MVQNIMMSMKPICVPCGRMVRFAVVGDAFVDVVAGTLGHEQLPKWGGDVECNRPIQLQPGGSALNTSTHLATLGRNTHSFQVELHSLVGSDAFGDVLKKHLKDNHIELSSPTTEHPTGVCIVLSGVHDRSFVTYYGAAREYATDHIDQERLLQAEHIHIGGFYSCPKLQGYLQPILQQAKSNGATISLDTNYDSTEQWQGLSELLPLVDLIMPNEVEAMHIAGASSVDEAMQYFAARVSGLVVIKIGKGGARALCTKTKQEWTQQSYKSQVVDVTGAGDSFNSGFLLSWKSSNGDVATALKWGCATAAQCVSKMGACADPVSDEEVKRLVEEGIENESSN